MTTFVSHKIVFMKKPELLLPAGNVEAFYAALEGGADAVYLGLKAFNARGRAANFNNFQFLLLLGEAHRRKVKVYITLNTVIKNRELPDLLDTLWFLSKTQVDAIIIQDWGTYYLLKNIFPKMVIHASTQMANHNSLGLKHSKKMGIDRVVLARELTLPELTEIQKKSPVETEVFVHGALCYSFSGMCMFSSYLGGAGANRGMCAQPCRRFYEVEGDQKLVFSLKDNQLIDYLPQMASMGVDSLKIEGRLKSGEYVNRVAQAYRMVLDDPKKTEAAKELLELDMGRPKTQWFYANKVAEAISENPNTGVRIGTVEQVGANSIAFHSSIPLESGNRLRIRTQNDFEQLAFKITELQQNDSGWVSMTVDAKGVAVGNAVFLAGLNQNKFPSKLKGEAERVNDRMPQNLKKTKVANLRKFKQHKKQQIFVRLNSMDWLRKIRLEEVDQLILQLPKTAWESFRMDAPFLLKNKAKIWLEFPQFIPEKDIAFYQKLSQDFARKGYRNFSLSHLSQKELLPADVRFLCNENVYCYNDAAAKLLHAQGAAWVCSPYENEFDNLLSGANRSIIVPIHYYPKLFYSRQPVKSGEAFNDDEQNSYQRHVQNGITIVVPQRPVSLLQYGEKLRNKGFNQFLIDLSFEKPSKHILKRLYQKFRQSEQEQPSTTFNFKKGLK